MKSRKQKHRNKYPRVKTPRNERKQRGKNLKQEERFGKKKKKQRKPNKMNVTIEKILKSKRANREPKMSKNSELKKKKLGLVPENVQCYVRGSLI